MLISLLFLCLCLKSSQGLAGYKFEDNQSRQRNIPANGEMSIRLRNNMEKVGICISFFVNFNRYSGIVPILDLRTGFNEKPYVVVSGTGCLKNLFDRFLLNCSDHKHLKSGIHSSVLSTNIFLYAIREPRCKQNYIGYQILNPICPGLLATL